MFKIIIVFIVTMLLVFGFWKAISTDIKTEFAKWVGIGTLLAIVAGLILSAIVYTF